MTVAMCALDECYSVLSEQDKTKYEFEILFFQKFSANSGYLDRAVRPHRGAGMNLAMALHTCGNLQRQIPALPGQPVLARQPTRPQ